MIRERLSRSLGAQLFVGVLVSLLLAILVYGICFALGTLLLDHTVYGDSFMKRMEDRYFDQLREFVQENQITSGNLPLLNAWCSRGERVYLTLEQDGTVLYESAWTMRIDKKVNNRPEMGPEDSQMGFRHHDQGYDLTLNDGTKTRAFLNYYAGDAFYYWLLFVSGVFAFVAFSILFISFVHHKLRYIRQLRADLDILAGGDLAYAVTVKGQDELGELAVGIDTMRRSILTHQQTEEQMRTASSQLVTAMSHDLRTPLTSLLAYLEMMDMKRYDSSEQLQHFIHRSLEQSLRIKNMADKLFEYFLVYSSELDSMELEDTDADEILMQIWGDYEFSLESQGITVRSCFSPIEGRLRIDPDLFHRVFDNLYSNLLKYADRDSLVEVTCARDGQQAILTIVNRISKTIEEREGTNIGLATCERILQYHGGSFSSGKVNGFFHVQIMLPLC